MHVKSVYTKLGNIGNMHFNILCHLGRVPLQCFLIITYMTHSFVYSFILFECNHKFTFVPLVFVTGFGRCTLLPLFVFNKLSNPNQRALRQNTCTLYYMWEML